MFHPPIFMHILFKATHLPNVAGDLSLLTIGQDNIDARPTCNPVPSQNQLDLNYWQHEPTKGSERDSEMLFEAAPMG